MKLPIHNSPDSSFTDISYTFANGKYICIDWVYPLHILFAYLVVLTGFLAVLGRVVDTLRPYHVTFGRWYLIFMFWAMGTSLLIHNTGLPPAIIVSFIYLLGSITIGWNAIRMHISRAKQTVKILLQQKLIIKLKRQIGRKLSFTQRIFSFRLLHGIMMSFSFAQMVGRTFVTNPANSFGGCWTYPAYKNMDINKVIAVDSIPQRGLGMTTGIFVAVITVPTILIILSIALSVNFYYYRNDQKILLQQNKQQIVSVTPVNN